MSLNKLHPIQKVNHQRTKIVGSPVEEHYLKVSQHQLIDIDTKHETLVIHICVDNSSYNYNFVLLK